MSWGVASYKIKREDPRWCLARAIWVLLIIKISSEDNVSGQTLPSSFLEYSSGPDFMPFILCRIDFMPFFSREHIKKIFFADFPLSSHKRHKIRIYAGSASKRSPIFVPVRHEIGSLLPRTVMCSGFFCCLLYTSPSPRD